MRQAPKTDSKDSSKDSSKGSSKGSSKAVSNAPLPAEVLAQLVPKCAFEAQVVAAAGAYSCWLDVRLSAHPLNFCEGFFSFCFSCGSGKKYASSFLCKLSWYLVNHFASPAFS